ncbi:MAG: GNAT family N-acetyltransferase [Flavobacterium sp.]|nr:GNAT family N-acetyltransferase [Flavobacterium sp.]
MKEYQVRLYHQDDFELWNTFVSEAKNATFLFHRDFMEYHSNRFLDYSLMVFQNEKLVSVLPANKVENAVYSHLGLTYGGLVLKDKISLQKVILIFKEFLKFLNLNEIETLVLKQIPSIYCDIFSDEINYALFVSKANLYRVDALSVLNLSKSFVLSKDRKAGISKGNDCYLEVIEETNFELFWNEILIPNLKLKHNVKPVHSLEEITYLHSKFPDKIRQFNVYHDDKIVAGTTIFETKLVAHSQYISGNNEKNTNGSLDFLHHHLITNVFKDKPFFDFGISNENNGLSLNSGLLYWKESFGANTVVQNFYEVSTQHYKLLDYVLI